MTFENDFQILKNLTEIQSCSGDESKIREYIKKLTSENCDNIETDILGNLFCFINGQKTEKKHNLTILLDAHMDEKL